VCLGIRCHYTPIAVQAIASQVLNTGKTLAKALLQLRCTAALLHSAGTTSARQYAVSQM
jgi:hypothetical protein